MGPFSYLSVKEIYVTESKLILQVNIALFRVPIIIRRENALMVFVTHIMTFEGHNMSMFQSGKVIDF